MVQVGYVSECKIPNEKGNGKVRRGCKSLLKSKAKRLSKQSVMFKCQIWPEINKKFTKNCLDASNL